MTWGGAGRGPRLVASSQAQMYRDGARASTVGADMQEAGVALFRQSRRSLARTRRQRICVVLPPRLSWRKTMRRPPQSTRRPFHVRALPHSPRLPCLRPAHPPPFALIRHPLDGLRPPLFRLFRLTSRPSLLSQAHLPRHPSPNTPSPSSCRSGETSRRLACSARQTCRACASSSSNASASTLA